MTKQGGREPRSPLKRLAGTRPPTRLQFHFSLHGVACHGSFSDACMQRMSASYFPHCHHKNTRLHDAAQGRLTSTREAFPGLNGWDRVAAPPTQYVTSGCTSHHACRSAHRGNFFVAGALCGRTKICASKWYAIPSKSPATTNTTAHTRT